MTECGLSHVYCCWVRVGSVLLIHCFSSSSSSSSSSSLHSCSPSSQSSKHARLQESHLSEWFQKGYQITTSSTPN
ncbi:hypothetical protein COCMIDRAFT_103036 [Bipolaris oryzae ATCC 44560]|uniref:Uncharacterized protein n=1 Tax=Bipolaris oryzae ATCC 44560 TaxID=930090 RepID=W6ZGJ6_COCMI|nr:uncharacterized protein COCMIDRAFT_103036 [Bipolaris oryzae ATCC 44560]EUC42616.1 hypothetical protein COCMIDRAFT_103036 [Bipolaris oryzae ATCC 44560]